MELNQRVFLITGGTRGIGLALAKTLLGQGARVAVCGQSPTTVAAAEKTLANEKNTAPALVEQADVGSDADARRLTERTLERFGRIDVLVNNAAILLPPAPIVETTSEQWERILRVNVIGVVNMLRQVLPVMEKQQHGLTVNLSSGWGRVGDANVASYCASKFAVEAITQSAAAEVKHATVVALNPGVIATDMLATVWPDTSAYDRPDAMAPRWLRLFSELGPAHHGGSLDLDDFAD